MLGDRLVVSGKAIGDQRGEDPRRHDDAELVVKAGDRELGGVDDVDVGVAGHAAVKDENRKLDERVRAFLNRGVTGDTDINVIDTAEFAIPGLDDEFRVIVSPWILTVLVTDRLARYYETVTKHNLKYRRYYHQFDY